jgi:uncharacterized membrane protein (UPF0127 family)
MRRALVALCLLLCSAVVGHAACQQDRVSLRGDWGEAQFSVEIMDDPQERARGMMFREHLPASSGMLFIYERPQRVSFWMKNTLIPLDMIFVDQRGEVQRIKHEAQPGDLTSVPGGDNILVVLEINGGLSRRLGIGPGSQMRHPVFSEGTALWPC